jgi:hypothetical protein
MSNTKIILVTIYWISFIILSFYFIKWRIKENKELTSDYFQYIWFIAMDWLLLIFGFYNFLWMLLFKILFEGLLIN